MTPSSSLKSAGEKPAGEQPAVVVPASAKARAARPILIAACLAAIALLLAAARLPIWRGVFSAPQYPEDLRISAYGHAVKGDLGEINELSHYIGMPPFDFVGMPEMTLWPLVIAFGIAAAVLAVLTRRRWLRWLGCTALWLIPVGALADVQYRLWQTGHSLDPTSAIRVPPFTPHVVGPTTLMNFTLWAYPGWALILIALAAALVTSTPFVVRRLTRSGGPDTDAEPTDAELKAP